MEPSDLLITLLSNGVGLDGAGADGIERFEFVSSLEEIFSLLDRLPKKKKAAQGGLPGR